MKNEGKGAAIDDAQLECAGVEETNAINVGNHIVKSVLHGFVLPAVQMDETDLEPGCNGCTVQSISCAFLIQWTIVLEGCLCLLSNHEKL